MKFRLTELMRDDEDRKYWAGLTGMTGAACLAVAFIEFNVFALLFGIFFSMLGLRFNRTR